MEKTFLELGQLQKIFNHSSDVNLGILGVLVFLLLTTSAVVLKNRRILVPPQGNQIELRNREKFAKSCEGFGNNI